MKYLYLLFFVLLVILGCTKSLKQQISTPTYLVGGKAVALPPPTKGMVEVGDKNRSFLEIFVPQNNRLIAGFVSPLDLARLENSDSSLTVSKFALVEINRQDEHTSYGSKVFKQYLEEALPEIKKSLGSTQDGAEEEFNNRLSSLNLSDIKMAYGQPIYFGSLFSKKDAIGLGALIPFSMSNISVTMASGLIMMRVKTRFLILLLYAEYKDKESLVWLRKTSEAWSDAVLKAN